LRQICARGSRLSAVKGVGKQSKIHKAPEQDERSGVKSVAGVRALRPDGNPAEVILVAKLAAKKMVVELDLTLRAQRPRAQIAFSPGNPGWVLKTES
jgi:hypothetical protein